MLEFKNFLKGDLNRQGNIFKSLRRVAVIVNCPDEEFRRDKFSLEALGLLKESKFAPIFLNINPNKIPNSNILKKKDFDGCIWLDVVSTSDNDNKKNNYDSVIEQFDRVFKPTFYVEINLDFSCKNFYSLNSVLWFSLKNQDKSRAQPVDKLKGSAPSAEAAYAEIPESAVDKLNLVSFDLSRKCDEFVGLSDEIRWIDFQCNHGDYIKVGASISYVNLNLSENKKCLAVVQYRNAKGEIISGPYEGLKNSEAVGQYEYLKATNGYENILSLKVPVGGSWLRLGFRTFYLSRSSEIRISKSLMMMVLDDSPKKEKQANIISQLNFEASDKNISNNKLRVAIIADEFTFKCFEPEIDTILITPKNWRDNLFGNSIDFLFVESAWHGNNDEWIYRIGEYKSPPDKELDALLTWCKKYHIPTVFWNKEDPPGFENFIKNASKFDYIFTTDQNCIERYRKLVPSHVKVGLLMFAAQPKIHNAYLQTKRSGLASFAGSYYSNDFSARARQQDILLRAAAKSGLDIYDRMFDAPPKEKERFHFPPDLVPYVRGKASYSDLVEYYKHYRVGLNVNSVADSPSMFSRRVFELLASGTAVVSTPSLGLKNFFPQEVVQVERYEEACEKIVALLNNPTNWLRHSVVGLRKIYSGNTYADRVLDISKSIGLNYSKNVKKIIVLLANSVDSEKLLSDIQSQSVSEELILIPSDLKNSQSIAHKLNGARKKVLALPRKNIQPFLIDRYPNEILAVMGGKSVYRKNYLLDIRNILMASEKIDGTGINADEFHKMKFDDKTLRSLGMHTSKIYYYSSAFSINRIKDWHLILQKDSEELAINNQMVIQGRVDFDKFLDRIG